MRRVLQRAWAGAVRSGPAMLIVLAFLAAWTYLPEVDWLSNRFRFLDEFFISSPQKVVAQIRDLAIGADGRSTIWPFMRVTFVSVLWGLVIGIVLGMLFGLLLAASPIAERALAPIINFVNATPRIAMIPIFVIAFGPSTKTSVITSVTVVFFIAFYNAYAGARSPAAAMVSSAQLLGASRWHIVRHIRIPYVVVWITAALPNAISFGLIAVVTAEILTGTKGMGRLIFDSLAQVNSTLTIALVIILGVLGSLIITTTRSIIRHRLAWWEAQTGHDG